MREIERRITRLEGQTGPGKLHIVVVKELSDARDSAALLRARGIEAAPDDTVLVVATGIPERKPGI